MHVARIGFTPVKGGRHVTQELASLVVGGAVGDRAFALVDPATDRCLRTVEHPTLLRAAAAWDGRVLAVDLPAGRVAAEPVATGDVRQVDYWGRSVPLEVVDGPWAAAYAEHLGRDVLLARAAPGDVVYGGAVTLVTNASLARLADEVGEPVDAARFRATFELSGDLVPHVEDTWIGRTLTIGDAQVRVRQAVPRCAVIDLDPSTGERDGGLMKALARYRQVGNDVFFGVDAEVVVPGRVVAGAAVTVAR